MLTHSRSAQMLGVAAAFAVSLLVASMIGCQKGQIEEQQEKPEQVKKVDDWQYELKPYREKKGQAVSAMMKRRGFGGGRVTASSAASSRGGVGRAKKELGFAVGGAKDVNNMRDNVENGYLPLPSDITCEGLFYDYYFDTGKRGRAEHLFEPSYSRAVSPDPISREPERYLTVGLNSNLTEEAFERKDLDLVIVMDVSGSMNAPFDEYYYDGGKKKELAREQREKSKIQVAREAVRGLMDHLRPNDRLGIVVFNKRAILAKPLRKVRRTDMTAIRGHLDELQAGGGTKMSAGMEMATELYSKLEDPDPTKREQRIIFLTDAMPNLGRTRKESLGNMFKKNAKNKIYTTFIGVGVDFNTKLVEAINKARGANHYSVHSPQQFKNRMDRNFEFMVTPLVFNLQLQLDAKGYRIEKVYGSPEADESTGELMKVKTLFPSRTKEGKTKGGVVLLKLRQTDAEEDRIVLTASYEDRSGETFNVTREVNFPAGKKEFYDNTGIRKAILLSRYAEMLRNWTTDEREALKDDEPVHPVITRKTGIIPCPPERPRRLGQWERKSVRLQVSDTYRKFFKGFLHYMQSEMEALGDENLEQEVKILQKLVNWSRKGE